MVCTAGTVSVPVAGPLLHAAVCTQGSAHVQGMDV